MPKRLEDNPQELEKLQNVLRDRFPTLHMFHDNGAIFVRGVYNLVHEGFVVDRYNIEIELPDSYPLFLPRIWETGGRIPRTLDRHVFPEIGNLCLGVKEQLWIALQRNFSIERFLDGPVHSYLIGNSLYEAEGVWPLGEYSHGIQGMLEFYSKHLGIKDPYVLTKFLLDFVKRKIRGHWSCPCGSGKRIRKCHKDAVSSLHLVPTEILAFTIQKITDHLQEQHTASC